jgi:hypothetical protein
MSSLWRIITGEGRLAAADGSTNKMISVPCFIIIIMRLNNTVGSREYFFFEKICLFFKRQKFDCAQVLGSRKILTAEVRYLS